jgi:hypothetical protein
MKTWPPPWRASVLAISEAMKKMLKSISRKILLAAIGITCTTALSVRAEEAEFAGTTAVADDHLNEMRGGFDTDAGLRVSIGIERDVSINGVLVSTTRLSIPDLGALSAMGVPAAAAALAGSPTTIIQNGAGNAVNLAPSSVPALLTVVQNSLDNQNIRSVTQIDATVTNTQLVRSFDLNLSLGQMLGRSAR